MMIMVIPGSKDGSFSISSNDTGHGGGGRQMILVGTTTLAIIITLMFSAARQTKVGKRYSDAYVVRPIQQIFSTLLAVMGFVGNAAVDLYNTKQGQWQTLLDGIQDYLTKTGIADEFKDTLLTERTIPNFMIIGEILTQYQLTPKQKQEQERQLKERKKKKNDDEKFDKIPSFVDLPSIETCQRYMKYATAVYGVEMMNSAILELLEETPDETTTPDDDAAALATTTIPDPKELSQSQRQRERLELLPINVTLPEAITMYIDNVREEDLISMDMESGDSLDYLRHMIVVDHQHKSVVLAIRGTFALSSIITDMEAFSKEFCKGHAHAGMAKMAIGTWDVAKSKVLETCLQHLDYKLVVTGHSLGAGVACLISILLHHDPTEKEEFLQIIAQAKTKRNKQGENDTQQIMECIAFAPPPVFTPLEVVQDAVSNTTSVVHDYDIVPSASLHAIRRVLFVMKQVDNTIVNNFSSEKRWRQIYFRSKSSKIPTILEDVVIKASNGDMEDDEEDNDNADDEMKSKSLVLPKLEPKDGAPRLIIPCKAIIWLENSGSAQATTTYDGLEEVSFSTSILDPVLYSKRLLPCFHRPDAIDDHMAPKYEGALKSAAVCTKASAQKELVTSS